MSLPNQLLSTKYKCNELLPLEDALVAGGSKKQRQENLSRIKSWEAKKIDDCESYAICILHVISIREPLFNKEMVKVNPEYKNGLEDTKNLENDPHVKGIHKMFGDIKKITAFICMNNGVNTLKIFKHANIFHSLVKEIKEKLDRKRIILEDIKDIPAKEWGEPKQVQNKVESLRRLCNETELKEIENRMEKFLSDNKEAENPRDSSHESILELRKKSALDSIESVLKINHKVENEFTNIISLIVQLEEFFEFFKNKDYKCPQKSCQFSDKLVCKRCIENLKSTTNVEDINEMICADCSKISKPKVNSSNYICRDCLHKLSNDIMEFLRTNHSSYDEKETAKFINNTLEDLAKIDIYLEDVAQSDKNKIIAMANSFRIGLMYSDYFPIQLCFMLKVKEFEKKRGNCSFEELISLQKAAELFFYSSWEDSIQRSRTSEDDDFEMSIKNSGLCKHEIFSKFSGKIQAFVKKYTVDLAIDEFKNGDGDLDLMKVKKHKLIFHDEFCNLLSEMETVEAPRKKNRKKGSRRR